MPRGRISALSLDFTRFEIVRAYRLPRLLRLPLGFWPLTPVAWLLATCTCRLTFGPLRACRLDFGLLRLPLDFWSLARLSLGETPAQTVALHLQILLRCCGFSLDLLRVSKGRARKSRFVQSAVIQSPHLLAELPRFSVLQRRLHIEHSRVKNI